jgi:transcriptional regulator with XRE-family HTH domain
MDKKYTPKSGAQRASHSSTRSVTSSMAQRRSLARALFLSGMEQTEIAEKVGVSRVTISKWAAADAWKEARAAKNITRPELVNKLLLTIDRLISQVNDSQDPALIAGLGDKLSKLSSVIEKLDKKANVVDAIEVFMAFSKWLEFRSQTDPEVTPELMKAINKYQDKYIIETMNKQ